jgi:hypothetical protein
MKYMEWMLEICELVIEIPLLKKELADALAWDEANEYPCDTYDAESDLDLAREELRMHRNWAIGVPDGYRDSEAFVW